MGAIAALAASLDFNFSRYILNEMVGNAKGKRKDRFLIYPRFLQMIFNSKYSKLEKRRETTDLKYLVNDESKSESASRNEDTEDEVITASEHEEDPVTPVAIVAEEHMSVSNEEKKEDDNVDDDDESEFEVKLMENVEDEDDMYQGEDLSGYDQDDLFFINDHNDEIRISNEDLETFLANVNEVAQPAMETEGVRDVLNVTPPTSDQMVDPLTNMDTTSRIPHFLVANPSTFPFESDPSMM
ncbi:nuclear polyadenylated RNA-binding protein 3-like [Lactuca sativa]|uniref:nuclear polyadenylated RNA-binding protein 3-like n=1 Tax=Lactuca sativa TaxID=4236 RepID=UPI000CD8DF96|nr:nuclear polyadenylated RNA-binding protein 3-like [Lactuca sativa]